MIDASLVEKPFRPGSCDGKREAVDGDAALTARKGSRARIMATRSISGSIMVAG